MNRVVQKKGGEFVRVEIKMSPELINQIDAAVGGKKGMRSEFIRDCVSSLIHSHRMHYIGFENSEITVTDVGRWAGSMYYDLGVLGQEEPIIFVNPEDCQRWINKIVNSDDNVIDPCHPPVIKTVLVIK